MRAKVRDYFRLIITVNSFLCILTFAGMIILAFMNEAQPTNFQINVYNTCETVFKMSAGAFIGLLGGKASSN